MNKKMIVREGLVFLAICGTFFVLAMILPLLFRIELWPFLTFMPFAPLVPLFYVLMRWRLRKRRCRS